MPDRVIGPLREIRQPLHGGLRHLVAAAEAVGADDQEGSLRALDRALMYVRETLLPYCHSEQFTLFPAVDGVIGAMNATRIMVAQHQSLAAMADDLARVAEAAHEQGSAGTYSRFLLPLLYGLYAAARTHLESEDDVYLTLLDEHLSQSQVDVIVENLARVAAGSAAPGG